MAKKFSHELRSSKIHIQGVNQMESLVESTSSLSLQADPKLHEEHKIAVKKAKESVKEKGKDKEYENVCVASIDIPADLETIFKGLKNPKLTEAMFRAVVYKYFGLTYNEVKKGSQATAQAKGEVEASIYKISEWKLEEDEEGNKTITAVCELAETQNPKGFFGKMKAEFTVTLNKDAAIEAKKPISTFHITFKYTVQGLMNSFIAALGFIRHTVKTSLKQACARVHLFFTNREFFDVKQNIFNDIKPIAKNFLGKYHFGVTGTYALKAPVEYFKEILNNFASYNDLYENFQGQYDMETRKNSEGESKKAVTLHTMDGNIVDLNLVKNTDSNGVVTLELESDGGAGNILGGIKIIFQLEPSIEGKETNCTTQILYKHATGIATGSQMFGNIKDGNLLEPIMQNMAATLLSHLHIRGLQYNPAAKQDQKEENSSFKHPVPRPQTQVENAST